MLEERGVQWYRDELAARLGAPLAAPVEVRRYEVHDHLGWQRQADGCWLVGIWIENGELSYPVEEVTIAGNLKEMFQNIGMVGNDLEMRGRIAAPTIKISRMTVAGN